MFPKKCFLICLYVGVLSIEQCFAANLKVAIVGTGIGGASASHFLTELFDKNIDIDMFEANEIGGRLATVKFNNEEYESGGSIIHPTNKYMKQFVKMLNLSRCPSTGGRFDIWNGKELVFEESNWELFTVLKLVYKYGIDVIHLYKRVSDMLNNFKKIYDLQDKNIAFTNVTTLIGTINKEFLDLLRTSIKNDLTKLKYNPKLIDELVKSTLVVNYGQDTDVQAFVGYISVAGAGYALWSVKGGNKQVPKHLIKNNEQVTVIYSVVERIHRRHDGIKPIYDVFYKDKNNNKASRSYDIVVLAAPMTNDQEFLIKFKGFNKTNLQVLGNYQTTFATFVVGNINNSYFGLNEEIDTILSCDPNQTVISSIGKISSVEGTKANVWKIFSRQKLSDEILNNMFLQIEEVKEIAWKAYPHYSDTERHDNFKIDDLVYYVNAIEWAASAMEMSAISGRNAAILAYNDYQRNYSTPIIDKIEHVKFSDESTTLSDEL